MASSIVDQGRLPKDFPTHAHAPAFWEQLGRVVGSFGVLEDVLARAIFALSGTRPYTGTDPEKDVAAWGASLSRALSDTLNRLIKSFDAAVREHPRATVANLEDLTVALREAARLRNVLCHGAWQVPDADGKSVPRFFTPDGEVFNTAIDVPFLEQTRAHVAELICEVINVVTHMGYQFPGSGGPGEPVWCSEQHSTGCAFKS